MNLKVSRILEKMVPDPDTCRRAAMTLQAEHPDESPEQLARRAILVARKTGAGVGAATGAFVSPFTMVPAAMADMAAMLRIEGGMTGVIAALMDPASLDDPGSLRTDIVSILFPGAISQVFRQLGVRAGEQASRSLIRKLVTEDLLKVAVRVGTKHLGMDLTRKTIMEKTVPLVGAGIGAGWNWLEVGAVGERAIRYYKGEPLQLPGQSTVGRATGKVKEVLRRLTRRDKAAETLLALPPPPPGAEAAVGSASPDAASADTPAAASAASTKGDRGV